MSDPALILADSEVNVHDFMLQDVDTDQRPTYTVAETGMFFFAKGREWLPRMEREGRLLFDGKPIPVHRVKNIRYYTLGDIELIAHGLAQCGVLPGERLRATLQIVRAQARLWLYL